MPLTTTILLTDTSLLSRRAKAQLAPGSRTLTFAIKRANTAGKITHPLEVFRTPDNRGWGVRAAKRIPAGEFVSLTTPVCFFLSPSHLHALLQSLQHNSTAT